MWNIFYASNWKWDILISFYCINIVPGKSSFASLLADAIYIFYSVPTSYDEFWLCIEIARMRYRITQIWTYFLYVYPEIKIIYFCLCNFNKKILNLEIKSTFLVNYYSWWGFSNNVILLFLINIVKKWPHLMD